MKLIDPSYEIVNQKSGTLEDIYKHIEYCGRTCYKSEDKITEDSAEGFVQRMIDNDHTAMLEHGTVYLYIKHDEYDRDAGDPYGISLDLLFSKYTKHKTNYDTHESWYTTNLRWLVEKYPEKNGNQMMSFSWKDVIKQYGCEPTEHHPKRHTVKLVTSLHVYKDLTRHRTMSFAIESTRYCNYSKSKFNNELTFIKPCWCKYISVGGAYWHDGICFRTGANEENNFIGDRSWTKPHDGEDEKEWKAELKFIRKLDEDSKTYNELIALGWQAQQAAEVLPQCVKGDVIITGFEEDWDHVFDLRALGTTGAPHPEVKRIITPIMEEFYGKGWTDRTLQKADIKIAEQNDSDRSNGE